jgi:hypothetical protein
VALMEIESGERGHGAKKALMKEREAQAAEAKAARRAAKRAGGGKPSAENPGEE